MNMKFKSKVFFLAFVGLLFAQRCYADIVWPAIYVLDSYYRFYYIAILTVVIEAIAIAKILKINGKKASLMSLVANIFSATIGLYISTFSMLGWHFIVDNFTRGTFNTFNEVATIFIMLILSIFLEGLVVKFIWKYKIKEITASLSIGNIISYSVIAADLFMFGGWSRQF